MTGWLLLGIGLLLLPPGRAEATSAARDRPPERSARSLQLAAVAAVCAGGVVGLGPTRGIGGALVAAPLVWVAVDRLHARPARRRPDPGVPLVLDLVAAALRAGQPLAAALVLAAPAAGAESARSLSRVGRLLALGAEPSEAWAPLADDPVLGGVAAAARRSATSGIRLAASFEQAATDLRASGRGAATARAHRAGVFAVAPLGLCFLPAFVLLGIVPVVVGIAHGVLATP